LADDGPVPATIMLRRNDACCWLMPMADRQSCCVRTRQ
jgi:hypothetical protein